MQKLIVVLIALLFNAGNIQSQNKILDSLLTALKSAGSENERLPLYREVGLAYFRSGKADTAIIYFQKGLSNAIEMKSNYYMARLSLQLSGAFVQLVQKDSADKYLNIAYPILPQLKNDTMWANYYHFLGINYSYKYHHDEAVEAMLKCVEILEKMGDKIPPNLLPQSYGSLSNFMEEVKQYDKAISYNLMAIQNKNTMANKIQYGVLYFNMASKYSKVNDYAKMKLYLDTATFYNNQYYNNRTAAAIFSGYGKYYEENKQYDSAISNYQRSYDMHMQNNDAYFAPEQAYNIANVYFAKKNYGKTMEYVNKGLRLTTDDYDRLSNLYLLKEKVEEISGNYTAALKSFKLHKQYADSVVSAETNQNILGFEARYESSKKAKEIIALKAANIEKELTVVKRNRLLLIGGISAASLLLILGLFYRNSRHRQTIAEKEQILQQEQIRFLKEQQQVVSLQSMINGQETERTRIAKDLHDGLGGLFSTVKMHFSTLQHDIQGLKENLLFSKSYELVDSASVEVRRIAHNMMPEVLLKLGLPTAIKDLCDNINAGKLLNVSLEQHGMSKRLNAGTEIMLYRIVQELLNNIIKHANATEAIIQFIKDDNRLSVVVEDNGRGFNTQEADEKNHAGIETVKSRVSYLNGRLTIDSQKDIGTTVMMDFLINE